SRAGIAQRHIFEDCAHWWALAHHCLAALDEIHRLQLVHLDIKADNICVPYDPATFEPLDPDALLHPAFARLALIDFAFSLVSREPLATALPIGWQKDYDYQSPRLLRALEAGAGGDLRPTQELDWRCDLYSLAAMLRRYLPDDEWARSEGSARGWTMRHYDAARALVYRLRDAHDRDLPLVPPHAELMHITSEHLGASELASSLARGWTVAPQDDSRDVSVLVTPLTRIAAPRQTATPTLPVPLTAITEVPAVFRNTRVRVLASVDRSERAPVAAKRTRLTRTALAAALASALIGGTIPLLLADRFPVMTQALQDVVADVRSASSSRDAPHEPIASASTQESASAREASQPAPATPPSPPEQDRAAPEETGLALQPMQRGAQAPQAVAELKPAPHVQVAPAPHPQLASAPHPELVPAPARSARRAAPPSHAMARATPQGAQSHPTPAPRVVVSAPRMAAAAPNVDLAAAAKATQALVVASMSNHETAPGASAAAPAAATEAAVAPPAAATHAAVAPPATTAVAPLMPEPAAPVQRIEPRRARPSAPAPAPVEPWRLALRDVMAALNLTQTEAAPVEERNALSSSSSSSSAHAAPRSTPPATTTPMAMATPNRVAATPPADDDAELLLNRAQALLRSELPAIAAQAQSDIAPVLWTAAGADVPSQDRAVVTAALARWESERMRVAGAVRSARARELHEHAKRAFALGHDHEALEQALRAFAADPRDAEIAGFVAYLQLRVRPSQPEIARQLALYALALSGSSRRVRHDDWNTFAVASALSGRESDASRALLAELSLTTDVDRSCRAALGAYNMFGERLRAPVQAFMYRVHAQGRDRDSISCRWGDSRPAARYAADSASY
ncbi:MAG TPA: hypothetical protein VFC24_18110, partial [Casimicrobiaceae bacterium]|nr:hypothetical protein [Casimicrobiaceae bacterium]